MSKISKKIDGLLKRVRKLNEKIQKLRTSSAKKKKKSAAKSSSKKSSKKLPKKSSKKSKTKKAASKKRVAKAKPRSNGSATAAPAALTQSGPTAGNS